MVKDHLQLLKFKAVTILKTVKEKFRFSNNQPMQLCHEYRCFVSYETNWSRYMPIQCVKIVRLPCCKDIATTIAVDWCSQLSLLNRMGTKEPWQVADGKICALISVTWPRKPFKTRRTCSVIGWQFSTLNWKTGTTRKIIRIAIYSRSRNTLTHASVTFTRTSLALLSWILSSANSFSVNRATH